MIHLVCTGRNTSQWVEQHFDGLLSQETRFPWKCTWIDDASDDDTLQKIPYKKCEKLGVPFRWITNDLRRGSLANIERVVRLADPEDIIILWDSDDFFASKGVLHRIGREYEDPHCWMTYGGYRTWPAGHMHYSGAYTNPRLARNTHWKCAPPRSFRAWLFQELADDDLRDEHGEFWLMATDQAICLPLLEMAGNHAKYISTVLYHYNTTNMQSHHYQHIREQRQTALRIRKRPVKEALEGLSRRRRE